MYSVTACDLEKSFIFEKKVEITCNVRLSIHRFRGIITYFQTFKEGASPRTHRGECLQPCNNILRYIHVLRN